MMSGNEDWNRNVFKRWQKVDRDGADITLSGRLFQMVGLATGKAQPPTVDSLMDGTNRQVGPSRTAMSADAAGNQPTSLRPTQ